MTKRAQILLWRLPSTEPPPGPIIQNPGPPPREPPSCSSASCRSCATVAPAVKLSSQLWPLRRATRTVRDAMLTGPRLLAESPTIGCRVSPGKRSIIVLGLVVICEDAGNQTSKRNATPQPGLLGGAGDQLDFLTAETGMDPCKAAACRAWRMMEKSTLRALPTPKSSTKHMWV